MLVVFEGIDGSGKTSLSECVMSRLIGKGYNVSWFKNPTDMKWGHAIRKIFENGIRLHPEVESEMFRLDRVENVEDQIKPALDDGNIVLQDRYYFSTAAYQGAAGLDWRDIIRENEEFCAPPNIVFFLSISPEDALSRIDKDGRERTAPEKLEVQRAIDKAYRDIFDHIKSGCAYPIYYLDASKDLAQLVDEVVERICNRSL